MHLVVSTWLLVSAVAIGPGPSATSISRVEAESAATAAGPDVIVGTLYSPISYGSVGGISAFAIGTESCNAGDAELSWVSNTNQHPVIAQNMFRLKEGRFEQIGQAWLKHGFFALQGNACQFGCIPSGAGGSALGVGCSDPYSASLNGSQANLGPKSQVDAFGGVFDYPPWNPSYPATIGRRLQVHNVDLDPALNPGALYFIEGQYVSPDDAAAGNQKNNASYRPIIVSGSGGSFFISTTGSTHREQPAILAWAADDPSVVVSDMLVPGEGLLYVASKATDLGTGFWNYEYAVQNLYSHRSVRSFSVPIDPNMTVENVGFHDVDYHSGEVYDLTDWPATISANTITWSTDDFSIDPNANALRWGTLYNFRFDADRPPIVTPDVAIEYFRPGTPSSSQVRQAMGPELNPVDCNNCIGVASPQVGPNPVAKNRFISFSYGASVCPTAMRVTLVDLPPPFAGLNGQTMWVRPPELRCENSNHGFPPAEGCGPAPGLASRTFAVAGLLCDQPYYSTEWNQYDVVHLYDKVIVPLGVYEIQAIAQGCDINVGGQFSAPLSISNSLWGDLVSNCEGSVCGPPNDSVDIITDAVAVLSKFSNLVGAPISTRADLWPELPDFKIDIMDALQTIAAFSGFEYPFSPPADPCIN